MKTDTQIRDDVMAELSWEPSVNATSIGVEVKDGVVTLAGHVGSFIEKWNAERAAQRVFGVRALAVEMDVKLYGSSERTDAEIAGAVESALKWTSYLPNSPVKVLVESGWVTLSGTVDWDYQRQAATGAVRPLMGVRGVSDQILLKQAVSAASVKSDIEAALKRRAKSDSQQIAVTVQGSEVTLKGNVQSWSERNLASHAAWGTPGVLNVVDRLAVTY